MMRRRAVIGALAFGVGLVLALSVFALGEHNNSSDTSRSNAFQSTRLGLVDPGEPLGPEGSRVTLDNAIATSLVPVYRPQTSAASDATLTYVWVRTTGTPEVYLRYESGTDVSVRPEDFAEGFETFFRGEIEQGYAGDLLEVQGIPVFVSPGNTADGAYADLLINGMLVEVVGKAGQSTDEIFQIVRSIIDSSPTNS
jgi:hypothetical protein